MGRAKSDSKKEPRKNKHKCQGISYIRSAEKWLAVVKLKGMIHPQFHVGYKPTEDEAIKLRDEALISKVYGPRAETFFPKKNYDVKKLEGEYWDKVFDRGVELAQLNRLDTAPKFTKGHITEMDCSQKTEKGLKVRVKHHGIDKPIVIGYAENEAEAKEITSKHLKSIWYQEHVREVEEARAFSEAAYKKFPEEANFDLMQYAHKGTKKATYEALMNGKGGPDVERLKAKFEDYDWDIFCNKEKLEGLLQCLRKEGLLICQKVYKKEEED